MNGSAIAMMIIGVLIIWGGFGVSVAYAIKSSKNTKE